MKQLISIVLLISTSFAQEGVPSTPEPTIESLKKDLAAAKAEIQQLKTQVAKERGEGKVCAEVMQWVYQQLVVKQQQFEAEAVGKR